MNETAGLTMKTYWCPVFAEKSWEKNISSPCIRRSFIHHLGTAEEFEKDYFYRVVLVKFCFKLKSTNEMDAEKRYKKTKTNDPRSDKDYIAK